VKLLPRLLSSEELSLRKLLSILESTLHLSNGFITISLKLYLKVKLTELQRMEDMMTRLEYSEERFKKN
jgi:hypothetical protein